MQPIVPLISSRATGPLGVCHLPRTWLKILLHATGRLPEGYRHGTGGLDERTLTNLGIDVEAFIAFVEGELPSYVQCEQWVRANAKHLDEATISRHNEDVLARNKTEEMAADQRQLIGIADSGLRHVVTLNDLDDWTCLHSQVTTGSIPGITASSLNASLTELLRELLTETKASRTTVRVDLPDSGFEPSKPTVEVRRPGVPSIADKIRTNMDASGTINFMKRERRLLIQDDLRNPDPSAIPPKELIEEYGTLAQMLGPVFMGDKLVAWISVHENSGPRHWTAQEQAALQRAVERATKMIEAAGRPRAQVV